MMKSSARALALFVFAAPLALTAQSHSSSSSLFSPSSFVAPRPGVEAGADRDSTEGGYAEGGYARGGAAAPGGSSGPFSAFALGAGISSLGIQLQAATNLSSHFNLRGTGSFFGYTDNFTSNGLSADAKLNLASAGAAVDIYPFRVGFRLSPGVPVL